MKLTHLAAAAGLCLGAFVTAPPPAHAQSGAVPAQRQAEISACATALGYRGEIRVVAGRAQPTPQRSELLRPIGPADAAAINECVQRRAAEPAYPVFPLLSDSALCYRDAPLLYRGNLYCFRDR